MKKKFLMFSLFGWLAASAHSQPTNSFPLWPDGAPGALGKADKDIPTLTPFFPAPEKATGAALVICPGGGYGGLAPHEGADYARFLNDHGITGFVLKYRLGPGGYKHPSMLQDAARALRTVRAKADEWKLDPKRIGIMGSSAGGHLASTLLTHFDAGKPPVDLVPRELVEGAARAYGYGAGKYSRFNWLKGGLSQAQLLASAMRHLMAYLNGEDIDPESGESHLDHTAACLGMAMATKARNLGPDDRMGK
jgi:hypothetical protein